LSKVVGNLIDGGFIHVFSIATDRYRNVYALIYSYNNDVVNIYQANSETPSKTFSDLPSTNNLILVKLNANGDYIWAASITGTSVLNDSRLTVYNNELYVQISTTAAVTINDASGVGNTVEAASIKNVVCKYTSEGQLAWTTYITGSSASNVVFEKNSLFATSVYLKMTYSNVTTYGTNAPIELPTYGSVLLSYTSAGEVAVVCRISP
jgi:hypothetical protein